MSKILDQIIMEFDELIAAPDFSCAKIPQFETNIIKELCQCSLQLFKGQPTILRLDVPIVIIGDIHGSLDDLVQLIKYFGKPGETKYLFLGDYVDRGDCSVPVITYLLANACKFPDSVFLIRGNHEFMHINRVYGFYDEVIAMGSSEIVWEYYQEVFYYLPLAAVVQESIFCVHGGLSPLLKNIEMLENLERPLPTYLDVPLVADLVWSDPTDEAPEFDVNQRGSGVLFGAASVRRFLEMNKFQLLVRAHQCTQNGVRAFANSMGITVFSCSDYSGTEKNKCGAMHVRSLSEIEIFSFTKRMCGFSKESVCMCIHPGMLGLVLRRSFDSLDGSPKRSTTTATKIKSMPMSRTKATSSKFSPYKSFNSSHPPILQTKAKNGRRLSSSGLSQTSLKEIEKMAKAPSKLRRLSFSNGRNSPIPKLPL